MRDELGCSVEFYHNIGERYQLEISNKDSKRLSADYEIKSSVRESNIAACLSVVR